MNSIYIIDCIPIPQIDKSIEIINKLKIELSDKFNYSPVYTREVTATELRIILNYE